MRIQLRQSQFQFQFSIVERVCMDTLVRIYECMNVWMYGCMNVSVCMNVWIYPGVHTKLLPLASCYTFSFPSSNLNSPCLSSDHSNSYPAVFLRQGRLNYVLQKVISQSKISNLSALRVGGCNRGAMAFRQVLKLGPIDPLNKLVLYVWLALNTHLSKNLFTLDSIPL